MPLSFRFPTLAQAFGLTALAIATLIGAAQHARSQTLPPQAQAAVAACRADATRFCAGVQPGGGRVLACLKAQGDAVSAPCRTTLNAAEARRAGGRPIGQ